MKKVLFTLIAALGISAVSQGAAYYWGTEAATADLNGFSGDTVYVLLASDWDATTATAESVANDAVSSAAYKSSRGKTSIGKTGFNYGTGDSGSLDVVFVDINADGKYFTWTGTLTGNAATETDPTVLANSAATISGALASAGGYQPFGGSTPTPPGPGPIPEPTSGLLLLVGGAMLALRRKQK